MRKLLIACFLVTFALSAFAASSTSAAAAAGGASATPAVALTPDQARQALDVLNDPQRRAQIEDTLRAVVAAGALSAVPASASAPAGASAAEPASSTASGVAEALQRNGLASQLARQGAHWLANVGSALRRSVAALLDVASVRAWWHDELASPQGHAMLGRVTWTLLAALLPALALEWLTGRVLRKASESTARRSANNLREARESEQEADAHALAVATAEAVSGAPHPLDEKVEGASGKWRITHPLSVLRRLPGALLHTLFRLIPLVVFVIVASALMSVLSDDGTPAGSALDALIDIYVACRGAVIISRFFLQPDAPALRLWRMGDRWAALTHRWVVWIAVVIGVGTGVAEVAVHLGMNDDAHLAIVKTVALVTHVMVSILILQCRRPVAARIRERSAALPSLAFIGNWLADVWAGLAVFVVMALWFVWALDVRNGYEALLHLGGISIAVLVAARVVSIVVFGALGRVFNVEEEDERSIAQQHAYRYYPLLRRVLSTLIVVVTALALLQVWGLNLWQLFHPGTIGHRLASALVTIAIAAVIALFVWEAVNASVEQRLALWTSSGDFVRAARLRTLLPMLRTALFVVIALVVVLTGLSELGVNTAPLLAGASIFGVALGFGSQKLVQDFITGIFLLMENAMQVGDWVTLAGVSGTVEYLSIRTVRLRGSDGSLYTVPFSSVSTVNNTNRGLGNAAVKVSVAYGQDVDLAIATLKEIGASLRNDDRFKNGILSDFAFWGVDAVDGASVTLTGQIQCRDTARWGVQREFNRRVLDLFQQRGIEISNPQRSVLVRGEGALTAAADGSQEPTPAKQPGAEAVEEQQPPAETQKAKGARAH
ncbi:mechanosensitive ion channel domain-containing protein [Paraburkholderia sp. GAS448]|uniref:mechanosensitive ion channel family protein n=1 Tax=Paraburkholderia sp. GAS448 TaxID=3035136 RepID=UPI003D1EDA80